MSSELVTTPSIDNSVVLYSESAMKYARKSKSDNTLTAYRSLLKAFNTWCSERGLEPLPAEVKTIVDYIAFMADSGSKVPTIYSTLAAIKAEHTLKNYPDPTAHNDVKTVFSGIRRKLAEDGVKPRKVKGIEVDELASLVAVIPDTLQGARDKALLIVGFAGAFRRSELVGITIEDVNIGRTKATIALGKSKTDQEGAGSVKVLPVLQNEQLCPVRALSAWLEVSGIESGAIFRQIDKWGNIRENALDDQSVALIVKKYCKSAHMNPRRFSGHSLRRGFVGSALDHDATPTEAMHQTKHASASAFQEYIEQHDALAIRAVKAAFGESAE